MGASVRVYGRPLAVVDATTVSKRVPTSVGRSSGLSRRPATSALTRAGRMCQTSGVSITTPRTRLGCSSAITASAASTCCARGSASDPGFASRAEVVSFTSIASNAPMPVSSRNGRAGVNWSAFVAARELVRFDDDPGRAGLVAETAEPRRVERLGRGHGVVDRRVELTLEHVAPVDELGGQRVVQAARGE